MMRLFCRKSKWKFYSTLRNKMKWLRRNRLVAFHVSWDVTTNCVANRQESSPNTNQSKVMQTIFLRLVSPQQYLAEVGEGQRVGRGHPPGGELQQGPARGAVQAAGRGTCLATRTLTPTLGRLLQTTKLLINLKRVSLVASACCPAAWRGRAGGRRSLGRWPPGSGTAAGSPWSPRPSVSAPRTPRHRHPCWLVGYLK